MSSSITIRTDETLKQDATRLFANLGMDMTTAINVFLQACVRQGGIPFAVVAQPDPAYQDFVDAQLAKSLERMQDPTAKRYTTDEMRRAFGYSS